MELFIERVFDLVRKLLLYGLSPFQTLKLLARKLYFQRINDGEDDLTVRTATLGDSGPDPKYKKEKKQAAMYTDARSCEDVITELG